MDKGDNMTNNNEILKIAVKAIDSKKGENIDVIKILLLQMTTAPELRGFEMFKELFIPFFLSHQTSLPLSIYNRRNNRFAISV